MNLDHLKVFYIAAIKRNFSETGKLLHLSQPSVSLQIKTLEASLSTKLFERTTKRIELTEAGQILFRYVEHIFELVDNAKKDITSLTSNINGDLNIGASLTIGEHLLPFMLGSFRKEYPYVKLIMKIYNSTHIVNKLIDEQLELGFIEAPMFEPSLEYTPIIEDELVIITSGHIMNPIIENREIISVQELFKLPFISREEGSGTRQVMENTLKSRNLEPSKLNVVLELENTESIKATVESGMGVSIISQSAIQKELKLGTLRELKVQGFNLSRHFYMVHKKGRTLSLPTDAFINFTKKMFLEEHVNGVVGNNGFY